MPTYQIIRYSFDGGNRVIQTGLTLEEAQEHCADPETSSRTCSGKTADDEIINGGNTVWFDGYTEE